MIRVPSLSISHLIPWLVWPAFISLSCATGSSVPAEGPPATASEQRTQGSAAEPHVIPKPLRSERGAGQWLIHSDQPLQVRADSELEKDAQLLVAGLQGIGLTAQINTPEATPHIALHVDPHISEREGYRLEISETGAVVRGGQPSGVFYGSQTLLQLLQHSRLEQSDAQQLSVPAWLIEDAPRFAYRGLMLDVSRHFSPPEFVKQLIDRMAEYKLNRFHWHLTDDQGWRIEIKKYPRLTETAAWRPRTRIGHSRSTPEEYDDKRHGGFYTQEQIRDVVQYAAERHITIVPEIELPGHSSAALAAYPELGCRPGPFEVATTWGIFEEVYCPHPQTFRFLEDVLEEVLALFPGEYVHIGGDEVVKTHWEENEQVQALMKRENLKDGEELQSYFVGRMVTFLHQKGRKAIGWDEILEGGLPSGAMVMSWRGEDGGIAAARLGHDVIMSPQTHLYFDHYQGEPVDEEPLAIGGYSPLEKVYSYEPIPSALDEKAARHVLGAQANVWTEYMPTSKQIEYMIFPRLFALAEVTWSAKELRDWDSFARRLKPHFERLNQLGSNHGQHYFLSHQAVRPHPEQGLEVVLTSHSGNPIVYTTDGSEPTASSPRYSAPLQLTADTVVTAATLRSDGSVSPPQARAYRVGLSSGRPVEFAAAPAERYFPKGALTNGVVGSSHHQDGQWVGILGKDFEATIDLGAVRELQRSEVGFLLDPGTWILLPPRVELYLSEDGKSFSKAGSALPQTKECVQNGSGKQSNLSEQSDPQRSTKCAGPRRERFQLELGGRRARYVRMVGRQAGLLPAGHPGAGSPSWLFADELLVE